MSEFRIVDHTKTTPRGPQALQGRKPLTRLHDLRTGAPLYRLDAELATAVNVALSVGAPLLLTGEPGTGKTQLAYYLCWYFGIEAERSAAQREQPFTLPVKSTTVWRDLLYSFDTVQYFHDAQRKARGGDEQLDPRQYREKGPLWKAVEAAERGEPAVVLIDEVDKAPRDFPNDLLRELDQFEIYCKETKERAVGPKERLPIVIITSNSEKRLPPAFLRRCIFHHIEFDEALVKRAVAAWRQSQSDDDGAPSGGEVGASEEPTLGQTDAAAVQAFMRVRRVPRLHKLPATAELLSWMAALDVRGVQASELGGGVRLGELPLLSALIKDRDDLKRLREA